MKERRGMMENCPYFNQKLLAEYLGNRPYCREERQFSVFLYYIFLEEKKRGKAVTNEIVKKCLRSEDSEESEIIVKDVFFEAAIMRDFFEQDRKKDQLFNARLLEFCLRGAYKGDAPEKQKIMELLTEKLSERTGKTDLRSSNLGQKEVRAMIKSLYDMEDLKKIIQDKTQRYDMKIIQNAKVRTCLDIASMMMNAVPDILVIFEKKDAEGNKTAYAKALECKYTSGEGAYEDILGAKNIRQLYIQNCIMRFCFGFGKDKKAGKRYVNGFPARSKIWAGNDETVQRIWGKTCGEVYNKILAPLAPSEEAQFQETGDVQNAGVEMIRFLGPANESKKKNTDCFFIPIEKLILAYR